MGAGLKLAPTDGVAATAASDVVMIFGYTSWGGAVRRGLVHSEDRLTLELMQSARVGRLLVCNPYRSVVAKPARALVGPRDAAFPSTDTRHLYEPLRFRRSDATAVSAIERSCAAYENAVRRRTERLGLERPAVITTHPLLAAFGRFDWAGPVTYYATDDLRAHPPLSPWWPAYDVAYARISELGRRVVGVTPKSVASVGPSGPSAVIPNGIDPDEWLAPGEAPHWFTALPAPRLLYLGTLDPRVEVESVAAVAKAYPRGSVVLAGRCPDPEHYASVRALPNVTIAPPLDRAQVTALAAAADVGLIPHVRDAQTEAMSPLKLYEYLAAGLPVASVDLPGVSSVCPERIVLANGADAFVAAVRQALELGRWSESDRYRFIHDNAWERRFVSLLDVALGN
jgi:teichuronic acid biosynthesis glycosyltransferase TuaH